MILQAHHFIVVPIDINIMNLSCIIFGYVVIVDLCSKSVHSLIKAVHSVIKSVRKLCKLVCNLL